MIFDAILTPILAALTALFDLLPTWSLLGSLGISMSGIGSMGGALSMIEPIFPAGAALLMVTVTYAVLLSVFTVYKLANWGYRHMPEILGCGPGGGG